MDIEPLLARLEALAPSFGRAQHDIQAMVTRGRSGDYKGVMQNCRLVLEALLRSMVSEHLKQTPGKAMLDELITKFRQQANAGVIPTNILAHMGTVQAWGNLSAHDHATKLTDDGVTVGKGEVMASLNSMVAILDWYTTAFGRVPIPAIAKVPQPAPAPAAAIVHETAKPMPIVPIAIGAVVLALGGAGAWFMTRAPAEGVVAMKPAGSPFAPLDRVYAERGEPVPPADCRSETEAPELAKTPDDPRGTSAEASYLLARARYEKGTYDTELINKALACKGFAAAHNLMGKIAIKEDRLADALPSFRTAVTLEPGYANARFNIALIHMKKGEIDPGIEELKRVVGSDPKFTEAHYLLARVYETRKLDAEAKASFCAAYKLGKTEAKYGCER